MPAATAATAATASCEQWDIFELALKGPASGNPFVDVSLAARFTSGQHTFEVSGFYDGDGIYRVRFMPPAQGQWRYETKSNRAELSVAAWIACMGVSPARTISASPSCRLRPGMRQAPPASVPTT